MMLNVAKLSSVDLDWHPGPSSSNHRIDSSGECPTGLPPPVTSGQSFRKRRNGIRHKKSR